jgi:YegS/Rv2252/BmrU family lipid kinase
VKAVVLINRGGGSVGERAAIERALEQAGVAADIKWLDGKDIPKAAEEALKSGAKLIVAGGGDGTISCVAGAIAGTNAALGILPLGTLNHFARDLGIPTRLEEAAKLLAKCKVRKVDVAEVNGRTFINNSSIGVYPLMVVDRESQQNRLGRRKRLAMAVAGLRTFLRFSSRRLTLTVNDHKAQIDTPLLFVGNNTYRLEMPGAGTREQLDAGSLSVVLLRRKTRWGFLAATARALLGRHRHIDVAEVNDIRQLRVDTSKRALTISLDGETALMETPLQYRIRAGALKVLAP